MPIKSVSLSKANKSSKGLYIGVECEPSIEPGAAIGCVDLPFQEVETRQFFMGISRSLSASPGQNNTVQLHRHWAGNDSVAH